jgi:hypothetical protein
MSSLEEAQAKMHELRVERVAAGLYRRAMAERRTFSKTPEKFQDNWNTHSPNSNWREQWRAEARRVLAGENQFSSSLSWEEFLNRVINEGMAAAKVDYSKPDRDLQLKGSIAGFRACFRLNIPELTALLMKARKETRNARLRSDDRYWYYRCYEAEVEWVCNVVSAALMNVGLPTIIPPTARGVEKAAEILGVEGDVESLSLAT